MGGPEDEASRAFRLLWDEVCNPTKSRRWKRKGTELADKLKGADLRATNAQGQTPCHVAARFGDAPVLQFLCQNGAEPHKADHCGRTPALWAARGNHEEALRVLVKHGVKVDVAAKCGWAPVHVAAERGCVRALRVLLEAGADVNQRGRGGWTPAKLAADRGRGEAMEVLLSYGTDTRGSLHVALKRALMVVLDPEWTYKRQRVYRWRENRSHDDDDDDDDPEEEDDSNDDKEKEVDEDKEPEEEEVEEEPESKREPDPEPWMLPLPCVTNAIYLKSYFPVLKYIPGKGPGHKRVWVVDHFAKSFYCLDDKGKVKQTHDANKLLQLEKNIMDSRRMRLMFFDAPKSYEILFPSNEERERFYETSSSIRPAIRVYAPSLTKPDCGVDGGTTTTTIDGAGAENRMVMKVPNPLKRTGEMVDRELSGRCKINSSLVIDEPVNIWIGTFNLCGSPPPRSPEQMESWCPRGKFDIYAIGTQECSYQKKEDEWFSHIQEYLGKDYLTLATMHLWDMNIIVLCKKKNLLKITNVEGSTKATIHKEKCGMKGGVGISLKFHNTSMAFINCHLAARLERAKMRNTNVQEIVSQIQLANKDIDLVSQFHHVFFFGDMNYRVEMEHAEAEDLIANKQYLKLLDQDQLNNEREEGGLFAGFKEAPITFAPTYRFKRGTSEYMRDRGRAPSYCDRVLHKSFRNTVLKCTGYGTTDKMTSSEHMPVYASYVVRCIRPVMNCFHRDQEPRPLFTFSSIRFIKQEHLLFNRPQVIVYSPFSQTPHKGKPGQNRTMTPEFTGDLLPEPLRSTCQVEAYLERQHLNFIFRDTAEPREDKMFRGGAILELDEGRLEYDKDHSVTLPVICLGSNVGEIEINYKITNYGYTPPPGGAPGRVPDDVLMDERTDKAEPGKLAKERTAAFEGEKHSD
eukprot:Hpha_TRINITY_DN15018_c10_g1::TRINITY_DN15018_c10_g1_i2::g.124763::m.124763/K15909/SHIP2, INPPL1; phosphatidylinositol-3,4,5-trisphosphate 5-phosphatase 2